MLVTSRSLRVNYHLLGKLLSHYNYISSVHIAWWHSYPSSKQEVCYHGPMQTVNIHCILTLNYYIIAWIIMRCRNLIHRILPWPMCTAVAKTTLFLAEVQSNRHPQLSQQFGPVDLVLKLQNPVQDMIWKKGRWNKNRLQYLKTNLLVFLTNSLEGGSKLL